MTVFCENKKDSRILIHSAKEQIQEQKHRFSGIKGRINHKNVLHICKVRSEFSFFKIIGAYCSTDWGERKKVEKKNLQYFGTGETFLFSLAPKRVKILIYFFHLFY